MTAPAATIGLMEGAYFVSKNEILQFLNITLELRLAKVEETASGCVACQLLDVMYPGAVPMAKVDWSAKKDHEWVHNYKILQTAFTKLKINRHIDVDRLIQGKYMDNLEFMQWFKRFFELQVSDKGDYDCKGRRALGKGGAAIPSASPGSAPSVPGRATGVASRVVVPPKPPAAGAPKVASPKPTLASVAAVAKKGTGSSSSSGSGGGAAGGSGLRQEFAALKHAHAEAVRGGNELRTEMEGLEKERDFYFSKLRDIEILMQDLEDNGKGNDLTASVFKILYATQDGFEQMVEFTTSDNAAAVEATVTTSPSASPAKPMNMD